ncbi:MAG: DUF2808 domain-containing protein [Cyanobacteriota bacterium]|nr:DUF2808 domain-containing protein [Cyanobacteriota bacterium]
MSRPHSSTHPTSRSHLGRQIVMALWVINLGTLAAGILPLKAAAQSGFVITGSEDVPVLSYKLDFRGVRDKIDRYRLDIPPQDVAVAEVQISGPPNFDGKIDPEEVRLEVEGQSVPLSEVYWNEEFRSLEVITEEPVAAGQSMRLILSQVRNPSKIGEYRFVGRLLGTEANPLFRTIGNWIISIDQFERTGF